MIYRDLGLADGQSLCLVEDIRWNRFTMAYSATAGRCCVQRVHYGNPQQALFAGKAT